MQPREKKLALIVGVLVLCFGLMWGYQRISGMFETRQTQLNSLRSTVSDKEFRILKGRMAAKKLKRWQEQSLPTNVQLARSLYQNWLLEQVEQSGLSDVDVNSQTAQVRRGIYDRLTFTVNCRGSLEALTKFLYGFYRADHLHQLRRFAIKPTSGFKSLEFTLGVEALVLPQADRTDALGTVVSDRLKAPLPEYVDKIRTRNLFAPYTPPPPPVVHQPPPPPPPVVQPPQFDYARHAFVTAVIETPTGPQVWLHVRPTGELLRLAVGEDFTVGNFKATVTEVVGRHVVLTVADQRLLLGIGENLRQAAPLSE